MKVNTRILRMGREVQGGLWFTALFLWSSWHGILVPFLASFLYTSCCRGAALHVATASLVLASFLPLRHNALASFSVCCNTGDKFIPSVHIKTIKPLHPHLHPLPPASQQLSASLLDFRLHIALQHSIIFLFSLVSNSLISTVFITSSLLALLALALILCCSSSWFLDTGFLGSGSGGRGRGRQFFDLVFDGAEGGCFAQGGSCYLIILSVIHNQEDLKTVSKELRSQQGEQKNPRAGRKDDKTYAIQQ